MDQMANRRSKRMRLVPFTALFALGTVSALVIGTVNCSRQEPFEPDAVASPIPGATSVPVDRRVLPFHSESGGSASVASRSTGGETANPFGSQTLANTLPAGTLITVRLRSSLSAATAHPGDAFSATLADPVIIDDKMFAAPGSQVTGIVQSSRTDQDAKLSRKLGYFELTLVSFEVNGENLPLQTSSLFARATVQPNSSVDTVRILKGHRLTFRLTAPVSTGSFKSSPSTAASRFASARKSAE